MRLNNNCKGCSKGLGDTVSSIIRSVSRGRVKECGGCKKRKELLNSRVPYNNIFSARRWMGSVLGNRKRQNKY
jgi:hypothetical protein